MTLHFLDYALLIPLMLLSLTCFVIGLMKLAFVLIDKKKRMEYQHVEEDMIIEEVPSKNIAQINNKELLFQLICRYDDDVIMKALEDSFLPLLPVEEGLDSVMLKISKEFGEIKQPEYARASLLTKRVAHILYRQYKKLNPNYSSPDFLQVV